MRVWSTSSVHIMHPLCVCVCIPLPTCINIAHIGLYYSVLYVCLTVIDIHTLTQRDVHETDILALAYGSPHFLATASFCGKVSFDCNVQG